MYSTQSVDLGSYVEGYRHIKLQPQNVYHMHRINTIADSCMSSEQMHEEVQLVELCDRLCDRPCLT